MLKALGLGEATGELDRHTSDLSLKYTWRFTLKYNMYFTVTDQHTNLAVTVCVFSSGISTPGEFRELKHIKLHNRTAENSPVYLRARELQHSASVLRKYILYL